MLDEQLTELLARIDALFAVGWFSARQIGTDVKRADLDRLVAAGLLDRSKPEGGNQKYITYRRRTVEVEP